MSESSFSIKDLIKLIKEASKLGVSELEIDGVYINFNQKCCENKENQEVPKQITNKLEKKITEESQQYLDEYKELLENEVLDCEDPEGYEEMIFNKTKIQKQDMPNE